MTDGQTITDPGSAPAEEVPAAEPAPAPEVPEVQPGEQDEPALDVTSAPMPGDEGYDFAEHAARVLLAPWPNYGEAPVIFTAEARTSISEFDRSVADDVQTAHDFHADACGAGVDAVNSRLDGYLKMRCQPPSIYVGT